MNLYLFFDDTIINFELPTKKIGNYWMTDSDDNNIVNINGEDGKWIISGSETSKVLSDNSIVDNVELKAHKYYEIEKNDKKYVLYCDNLNDNTFEGYEIPDNNIIKIGKAYDNDIQVDIPYIQDVHIQLSIVSGQWKIEKSKENKVYLNDIIVNEDTKYAKNGDVINIFGLNIVLSKNLIFINNPLGIINISTLKNVEFKVNDLITDEEIQNIDYYNDDDYFLKSPRMRKQIETFLNFQMKCNK